MTIASISIGLLAGALTATLLGRLVPRLRGLGYIGGLLWTAGAVTALVAGAELPELLIAALLLLLCTWLGERRGSAP